MKRLPSDVRGRCRSNLVGHGLALALVVSSISWATQAQGQRSRSGSGGPVDPVDVASRLASLPSVRGLVFVRRNNASLVAAEDETGVTFCGVRREARWRDCRFEREARLVPGAPRTTNADGRVAPPSFVIDGPRGTLEVTLEATGLLESARQTRWTESSRPLNPIFDAPWPREPERPSAGDAAAATRTPVPSAQAAAPDWLQPIVERDFEGQAFVLARRGETVVQAVEGFGRARQEQEMSWLLVRRDGVWVRDSARPMTLHDARILDAFGGERIVVLELESQSGGGMDIPMGSRAFLRVVNVGARGLGTAGQLEVGGVSWVRVAPSRSDVRRWFFAARLVSSDRVELTLDHAYQGVFDRARGGFVGTTSTFQLIPPGTRRRPDEPADELRPIDRQGIYVFDERRGFRLDRPESRAAQTGPSRPRR